MDFLRKDANGVKTTQTIFYDPNTQTVVAADTILTGKYTFSSDVTEFPVDTGETISDHAIIKPTVVNFDCIVSDTPVLPASFEIRASGSDYQVTSEDASQGNARDAYSILLDFWTSRTPLTVVSGLDVLTSMLITSIVVDMSKHTSTALYFTIALKQIRVVSSAEVQVNNIDAALADKLASEQKEGNKNAESKEVPKSLIIEGGKAIGIFGGAH